MVLIDLNVWVYAYNPEYSEHVVARDWVESVFASGEIIYMPWSVIVGFTRLIGLGPLRFNRSILDKTIVNFHTAIQQGNVTIINPGPHFLQIYQTVVTNCQAYGNWAPDAYLAALAIESGIRLASNDKGFSRFESEGLVWFNPL